MVAPFERRRPGHGHYFDMALFGLSVSGFPREGYMRNLQIFRTHVGRDRDSAHNNCAGFACLAGIYTRKD